MQTLRMVVPKGRMFEKVVTLLGEAGVPLHMAERDYRPIVGDPGITVKIMKPQNVPHLLHLGSHDIGFTGYDWLQETGADVVEIMDLGFDPVRLVAAIPNDQPVDGLRERRFVAASEYERITRRYLDEQGYDYHFVRTFGATEVFPPDDADLIVDNSATGRTLQKHDLTILDEILRSSTRFVAHRAALDDPWKRERIERLRMLFASILDARGRVMLEMNVAEELLEAIIEVLPCMRAPTVSPLYHDTGYAVKAAVKRDQAATLIPMLSKMGATDILEYDFRKVVI
ncbi:MAG: ATP phosphoribosyltransferase [Ardenticatenales bacterium]|nr:ATP phosphoribosyltransferase [Ardenticatenales bacterium]